VKKVAAFIFLSCALVIHFTTGIWSQEPKTDKEKAVAKEEAKKEEPKKEEAKKELKGNPTGEGNQDRDFVNDDILKATGKEKNKEGDLVDYKATTEDLSKGVGALVDQTASMKAAMNMFYTLMTGFLVMFMQAGFACVEIGLCRAKHVAHTMAMNFMIYAIGMLGFYFVGFGIMFGGSGLGLWGGEAGLLDGMLKYDDKWGLIGTKGFMLAGRFFDASLMALFLFQMVFMDTTCTIPTGAMAERWKFIAFVIFGFVISTIIYPVYGCWTWGSGWLSQLGSVGLGHGHVDFAGSSVVHMTGGVCSLVGAWMIGPRIGKYGKDGSVNVLPAHSLPMYMLGTFILAFGWFGFNAGSAMKMTDMNIARCAVTTMLASASGAFVSMTYMWLVYGKPDPSFMCNGMLAGLVAITAPCGFVTPMVAVLIGAIAGVLVIWSALFWEKVVKIDDPVGAISVHGVCGAFGILCIGLFSDGTYGAGWNGTWWAKSPAGVYQLFEAQDKIPADWSAVGITGIFYGSTGQLTASLIGILANIVWVSITSFIMFKVIDLIVGLRVKAEDEIAGLDIPEMGVLGYINDDPKTPEGHLSSAGAEPRAAVLPRDGKKRFTVVLDGLPADKIAAVWSEMCQPKNKPTKEFLEVYPKMTSLVGNRFRFADGDPEKLGASLAKIFSKTGTVKTVIEK
jgi:Amt family ammonium transporter